MRGCKRKITKFPRHSLLLRCRCSRKFQELPFWQAIEEVQLHCTSTPSRRPRRAPMFTGVSAFQIGLIHIIAGMMGAGVFERYPRLRVIN